MSTTSSPNTQLSIKQLKDLSIAHHDTLLRAIENVFSTDLTETTMAQLVDGLILVDVLREARGHDAYLEHPIWSHKELCEGAREKYKALKAEFNAEGILFDQALIHSFIKTIPGERLFNYRLIELVSRAAHAIAAQIFTLDEKFHPQSEIDSTTAAQREPLTLTSNQGETAQVKQAPPPKTLFFHTNYQDYHQYPNGIADIAAFWAEDRIFGGIFVFDRGETGTESNDVFLHSGREQWTVRVWRLLDSQVDAVMNFLTMDPDDPASTAEYPFPLFGDEKNTYRFDHYDAMAWHNIYRDPWERELPPEKNWDEIRRNTFDYPETLAHFPSLDDEDSRDVSIPDTLETPPGLPQFVFDISDPIQPMGWRDPALPSPTPSEIYKRCPSDAGESTRSCKSHDQDNKL